MGESGKRARSGWNTSHTTPPYPTRDTPIRPPCHIIQDGPKEGPHGQERCSGPQSTPQGPYQAMVLPSWGTECTDGGPVRLAAPLVRAAAVAVVADTALQPLVLVLVRLCRFDTVGLSLHGILRDILPCVWLLSGLWPQIADVVMPVIPT